MSRENVEISRRTFEAYNAGDMTTLRELYDPDVVMHHVSVCSFLSPGCVIHEGTAVITRVRIRLCDADSPLLAEGEGFEPSRRLSDA